MSIELQWRLKEPWYGNEEKKGQQVLLTVVIIIDNNKRGGLCCASGLTRWPRTISVLVSLLFFNFCRVVWYVGNMFTLLLSCVLDMFTTVSSVGTSLFSQK